jgi:hypothetical protein
MPNSTVKSFAKKSGKSEEEVEKIWKETEKEIKAQMRYKTGLFWSIVNSTVQKKLKIDESTKLSFKDYVELLDEDK